MDPLLRQRLVGTLVLVALGVVFWPLIFVTPELREPIVLQPVAQRPLIDKTPIPEPESYEASVRPQLPKILENPRSSQELADNLTQTDVEATALSLLAAKDSVVVKPRVAPPSADTLIDDQGVALFYVLQVATVGSAMRADEIVERLRARGYKAFKSRFLRGDDELFRIQIGPNAERAVLMQIKPEVDVALIVDSQILRYVQ